MLCLLLSRKYRHPPTLAGFDFPTRESRNESFKILRRQNNYKQKTRHIGQSQALRDFNLINILF